jgi:hypothetical protein
MLNVCVTKKSEDFDTDCNRCMKAVTETEDGLQREVCNKWCYMEYSDLEKELYKVVSSCVPPV